MINDYIIVAGLGVAPSYSISRLLNTVQSVQSVQSAHTSPAPSANLGPPPGDKQQQFQHYLCQVKIL